MVSRGGGASGHTAAVQELFSLYQELEYSPFCCMRARDTLCVLQELVDIQIHIECVASVQLKGRCPTSCYHVQNVSLEPT